ncbi:MAG: hypothetical protein JXB05_18615 [Myxococcaceae bacterium]|nr:hypothetical protein [Myxococcaceae bacterium]
MAGAVGRPPPTTTARAAGQTQEAPTLPADFKASSTLQNGKYTLTEEQRKLAGYHEFIATMGESHDKAISGRVENKMQAWVNANPNAGPKEYTDQLKKTLQVESMTQQMLKDSVNKMMNDIMNKMKEMASDRFE